MRLLFVVVLFLSGAISWANTNTCEAHFGPNIEAIIERAGDLEASLTSIISNSKRPSDVQQEVQKLEKLQVLIEDLLNYDGLTEMAIRLEDEFIRISSEEKKDLLETAPKRVVVSIIPLAEAKSALKDLATLQPYLKEKYANFIEEVSRVSAISDLAPSWALERINVHDITFEPTYSVRLNRGYRVLFVYERATGIRILRISMKVTH